MANDYVVPRFVVRVQSKEMALNDSYMEVMAPEIRLFMIETF